MWSGHDGIYCKLFLALIALVLIIVNQASQQPSTPLITPTLNIRLGTATPSSLPSISATHTSAPSEAHHIFCDYSVAGQYPDQRPDLHTALPIAVQALVQGKVTPVFDVEVGRLRFSTEINNYQLVAPANEFFKTRSKRMNAVLYINRLGQKWSGSHFGFKMEHLSIIDNTS